MNGYALDIANILQLFAGFAVAGRPQRSHPRLFAAFHMAHQRHPICTSGISSPEQPVRQWVLRFPYPLRFLFASRPSVMGEVLGIVYRLITTHLIKKAGFTKKTAQTGAVTLIQRFGSALNLNIHL